MLHDFSPVLCGFMCALGDDSRQSLWMEPITVWLISNFSNQASFVTRVPFSEVLSQMAEILSCIYFMFLMVTTSLLSRLLIYCAVL